MNLKKFINERDIEGAPLWVFIFVLMLVVVHLLDAATWIYLAIMVLGVAMVLYANSSAPKP